MQSALISRKLHNLARLCVGAVQDLLRLSAHLSFALIAYSSISTVKGLGRLMKGFPWKTGKKGKSMPFGNHFGSLQM